MEHGRHAQSGNGEIVNFWKQNCMCPRSQEGVTSIVTCITVQSTRGSEPADEHPPSLSPGLQAPHQRSQTKVVLRATKEQAILGSIPMIRPEKFLLGHVAGFVFVATFAFAQQPLGQRAQPAHPDPSPDLMPVQGRLKIEIPTAPLRLGEEAALTVSSSGQPVSRAFADLTQMAPNGGRVPCGGGATPVEHRADGSTYVKITRNVSVRCGFLRSFPMEPWSQCAPRQRLLQTSRRPR